MGGYEWDEVFYNADAKRSYVISVEPKDRKMDNEKHGLVDFDTSPYYAIQDVAESSSYNTVIISSTNRIQNLDVIDIADYSDDGFVWYGDTESGNEALQFFDCISRRNTVLLETDRLIFDRNQYKFSDGGLIIQLKGMDGKNYNAVIDKSGNYIIEPTTEKLTYSMINQKLKQEGGSIQDLSNDKDETFEVSEDKLYFIMNKKSGLLLDVYGREDFSEELANVQVYQRGATGNKSQQFCFEKTSGGWYSIVPASNQELAVNPYSNDPQDGDNINVYKKIPEDKTQGWYIIKDPADGSFTVCSAWNDSLLLTAEGNKNKSNVSLQAPYSKAGGDSQKWYIYEIDK